MIKKYKGGFTKGFGESRADLMRDAFSVTSDAAARCTCWLIVKYTTRISLSFTDSSDIHLPRPDKLQSPGDCVEQIATIDVPLQNGGTKTQEENPDPSKSIRSVANSAASLNLYERVFSLFSLFSFFFFSLLQSTAWFAKVVCNSRNGQIFTPLLCYLIKSIPIIARIDDTRAHLST
jgi:hypothetical protein